MTAYGPSFHHLRETIYLEGCIDLREVLRCLLVVHGVAS
jgi:hypothetical protein